jgi:hypothetical protein
MLPFEFASAGRIVFGRGVADQLGGLVAPSGRRVLLVHGASAARAAPHVDRLRAAGCGGRDAGGRRRADGRTGAGRGGPGARRSL